MKYKEMYGRKCTRDNRSVLPLRNKRPLLVPVLVVLAPNGACPKKQLKIARKVPDIFVRY